MLKHLLTCAGIATLAFQVSMANPETVATEEPVVVAPIYVEMTTNKGNITLELNPEKAPNTVGNFIQYVVDGHYEGLIFHRVIPGFMIQGGGWDKDLVQKKTRESVNIESDNGLKNDKGTIAMARTMDPDSATSQFFINTINNDFLNYTGPQNPGYTVFGHVVDGMEVVESIEKVQTTSHGRGRDDVPVEPVIIEKMALIEKPAVATESVESVEKPVAAPAETTTDATKK